MRSKTIRRKTIKKASNVGKTGHRKNTPANKEATMNLDYTNQDVYIGIDVHKKSYSVVAIVGGEVVKKARMPAHPESLVQSLQSWFPGGRLHTAYEAGFSGFVLHRVLVKHGISN